MTREFLILKQYTALLLCPHQTRSDMDSSLFDRKYRIHEICREFAHAHYESDRPSILAFLNRVPDADRQETLVELIAIDM